MKLFKKKILRSAQDDKPSLNDKVAKGIANFFLKVQRKFSDTMNKKFSGVPIKRMKILLTLFCLFWGGLSVYFIAHAVSGSDKQSIKIESVKVLRHVNLPEEQDAESKVDDEIYERIQSYKKYMDSSHEAIRPGLLDSMQILEQIYLQNKKNEANEK